MQYTVWSGKRQIGVTDLGFLYREGGSRTGWFYPTEIGEPLMAEIVEPLIGNYMGRLHRSDLDAPLTKDDWTRLAEYDAEYKRVVELGLQLRREDGSVVPTETVLIRDVEAYLSCYGPDSETWEDDLDAAFDFDDDPSEAWKRDPDDEAELELRRSIEHDAALLEQWFKEREADQEWTQEDDEDLPRYQIWVLLADPSAVP